MSVNPGALDSGSLAVDSRFQVLDSRLFHWNLDSGFQSLVGCIPLVNISNSGFHRQIFAGFPCIVRFDAIASRYVLLNQVRKSSLQNCNRIEEKILLDTVVHLVFKRMKLKGELFAV